MANTRSAEKKVRQDEKRTLHNRAQRSRLRTAIKKVMTAQDGESALAAYRETAALLDRFASRHYIHTNKARRKKAQLARIVQNLGVQP